jgi:hypothetical protein
MVLAPPDVGQTSKTLRFLPPPTRHTPWLKGQYEVAPGLKLLGEEKAFEFDTLWPRIRENKERPFPGRFLRADLDDNTAQAVVLSLAHRLASEWPDYFTLAETLDCHLTGESVPLDASGLDLLAMNLPCDLAIVKREGMRDWNAYLHVVQPSHWNPEEKIGRPFVATHAPIPHFEKVNAAAPKLIDAMITRGPWVRFVWGLETDTELDHHPARATPRNFATHPFVVRFERQVLLPLPDREASIFLIATGFVSKEEVLADEALWRPLKTALQGMSPQAREYKGVANQFDGLLAQFP